MKKILGIIIVAIFLMATAGVAAGETQGLDIIPERSTRSVSPGGKGTFTFNITNNDDVDILVGLSSRILNEDRECCVEGWSVSYSTGPSFPMSGGWMKDVDIIVTSSQNARAGDSVIVETEFATNRGFSDSFDVTVIVETIYDFAITWDTGISKDLNMSSNASAAQYTATVVNTGNTNETILVDAIILGGTDPAKWDWHVDTDPGVDLGETVIKHALITNIPAEGADQFYVFVWPKSILEEIGNYSVINTTTRISEDPLVPADETDLTTTIVNQSYDITLTLTDTAVQTISLGETARYNFTVEGGTTNETIILFIDASLLDIEKGWGFHIYDDTDTRVAWYYKDVTIKQFDYSYEHPENTTLDFYLLVEAPSNISASLAGQNINATVWGIVQNDINIRSGVGTASETDDTFQEPEAAVPTQYLTYIAIGLVIAVIAISILAFAYRGRQEEVMDQRYAWRPKKKK